MVGFAHAAMSLGGSFSLGICHLRWMNKYVENSMKVTGSPQPKWTVPRSTTSLPLHDSSGEMLSGVSAYAFQGTNAHALLKRPTEAQTAGGTLAGSLPNTARPVAAHWQREACWVAPPVHIMLHRVRGSGGSSRKASILLECQLSTTPQLAYFWDHRVGSRVLFPGAGFFEFAVAAGKAGVGKAAAAAVALAGATIPAPLQLPERQQLLAAQPVVLRASVHAATLALTVSSSPAGFKQQHLTATFVASTAVLPGTGSSATLLEPALVSLGVSNVLLASASKSAPMQQAAQASIDNSACDGTSWFHPASLDSCLQLAASGSSTALKVPAALGCLLVPDRLGTPQLAAASRQQDPAAAPDAPSVVDYWLREPGSAAGLSISQLQVKPLGKLPMAAGPRVPTAAANPAAAAAEQLLYEVSWPAAQPAEQAGAPTAAALGTVTLLPLASVATTAGAIAALQAVSLESLGGAQLGTSSALPAAGSAPLGIRGSSAAQHPAAGGLSGLMRALALEYQSQRFGCLDEDRLAPGAEAANGAHLALLTAGSAPSSDAYGAAQRGGVHHHAALLTAKARSSLPAFHLMPLPRGALGNLKALPVATAGVASGQVVLAVKGVGVNFR
jgi:hypothetical protein